MSLQSAKLIHNSDRLFPSDAGVRAIARELFTLVEKLPIISPHGHTDPSWFSLNENFANATELFISPDHYVYRMLYSQGIGLDELCVPKHGVYPKTDRRAAWRIFAENFYTLRGTPSYMWLNHVFSEVFGFDILLNKQSADLYYDKINDALATDEFKPRALFERFNIEVLATTESPIDTLEYHKAIRESDWSGNVITAYRPDNVIDPEFEGFQKNLEIMSSLSGEDCFSYKGYIKAHQKRRAFFKSMGATSTDHGHPTAKTVKLSSSRAEALFEKIISCHFDAVDAEVFRGHMLCEMARMSLEDGLVMQIHPGAYRNHNKKIFDKYGRDKGADVPSVTEYVQNLKPLLDLYGNEKDLTIILFTLDETNYAREIAPLAGHYPALKIGPAWWFNDSPEGMQRFRETITPIAGFYNTIGFNDDTRAFLSIPARHDMARRMDASFLANLVAQHRLTIDEASEIVVDLAYKLPKLAYKL